MLLCPTYHNMKAGYATGHILPSEMKHYNLRWSFQFEPDYHDLGGENLLCAKRYFNWAMFNSERYFVCEDCSDSADWLFWWRDLNQPMVWQHCIGLHQWQRSFTWCKHLTFACNAALAKFHCSEGRMYRALPCIY